MKTRTTAAVEGQPRPGVSLRRTLAGWPGRWRACRWSIPLMRSGQAMGVLGLASLYDYRPEDVEVVETLSLTFGQSLATCLASEQTERLAEQLRFSNEELTSLNEELQLRAEELRD